MRKKALKTLINISAGARLPQHEQEIFSDEGLTKYYLTKISEHFDWYDCEDTVCEWAYFYAVYVLAQRWTEAEHIIAANSDTREEYNEEFGVRI